VDITSGLQGASHASPSVDFVAEEKRKLEVVERGRPAAGIAIIRRFCASRVLDTLVPRLRVGDKKERAYLAAASA